MTSFKERAQEMGLDILGSNKGLYTYQDRYCKIAYRELYSGYHHISQENNPHPTDGLETPIIGIWTADNNSNEFNYVGYVSQQYKFVGNEVISNKVCESLSEVGSPILDVNSFLSDDLTILREETILQSSLSTQQVGDIHPVMIIGNSYNGQRAASVSFGITITTENNIRSVFRFSLGEMKMIHIESSNTALSSGITQYLEIFNNNITDMIDRSFSTQLTQEQMFATLDVIEKYGKRKRNKITEILLSLQPQEIDGNPQLPSAWNVFLAITRYCSLEPNLNIKRLLENVAESVLVVPTRMYEVLEKLN